MASRYQWLNDLVVLPILLGWIGGRFVGQAIGSNYRGIGAATGEEIGGWIGWSIGCPTRLIVCYLLARHPSFEPNNLPKFNNATLMSLWITLFGAGIAVAIGGIYGGKSGQMATLLTVFIVLVAWSFLSRNWARAGIGAAGEPD